MAISARKLRPCFSVLKQRCSQILWTPSGSKPTFAGITHVCEPTHRPDRVLTDDQKFDLQQDVLVRRPRRLNCDFMAAVKLG